MNYNELDLRGLSADQQLTMSEAFPILMRKVYGWMTLALVITGLTAYGVATSLRWYSVLVQPLIVCH